MAGFIAADGCVKHSKEWNSITLSISLGIKDREHLQRFTEDIEFTGNVKEHYNKGGYGRNGHTTCRVDVMTAKQVSQDLEQNFNITPRKTFTLQPPNIEEDNALAYIAGFIDGDGSISLIQKKYPLCQIGSASESMLIWIKSILRVGHKISCYKTKSGSDFFSIKMSGKPFVNTLLHIKTFGLPLLERKWKNIE